MSTVLSSNMNLPVPSVGNEPGPDFAFDINSSLTLIDQHDHSPGRGVQITPNGMNINTSLDFNNNSATDVAGVVFTAQSSQPTALQNLYVYPGVESPLTEDLWFTDGNGNNVQITSNGLVNATVGSLPGESYAAGTFTWVQGALSTTPANFDIGSITLRPNTPATTNGVTLSPSASISSAYSISLPLLPASQSVLTIDNSGIMATPVVFPLPATGIANGAITTTQISNTAGITGTQIASTTITASNIANSTITSTQIADHGVAQINMALMPVASGAVAGGVARTVIASYTNTTSTTAPQTTAFTATITIASPAVITVSSTSAMYIGMPVVFSTTGTLPTGIVAGTTYFISAIPTSSTFRISATVYGTDINTSGGQTGTQTARVTNSSVALTATGRPVTIGLYPNGSSLSQLTTDIAGSAPNFKIKRNGTVIAFAEFLSAANNISASLATVRVIDYPAAGNYSYTLETTSDGVGGFVSIFNCALTAYEI